MVWAVVWNAARPVGQLPGDEQAALATDLHADKALVKSRNCAADTLMKWEGLWIAELGFAVVAQHRLPVLVPQRRPRMVAGGVELDAIGRAVARVEDLVQLVRLSQGAGADLYLLVA